MNNIYDSKLLVIDSEADSAELELKRQKLYTKLDIEELEQKWAMRVAAAIGITAVVVTILISILRS